MKVIDRVFKFHSKVATEPHNFYRVQTALDLATFRDRIRSFVESPEHVWLQGASRDIEFYDSPAISDEQFFAQFFVQVFVRNGIRDVSPYYTDDFRTYVYAPVGLDTVNAICAEFNTVFASSLHARLDMQIVPDAGILPEVQKRLAAVETFYVKDRRTEIEKLNDCFADDISRASFASFIQQRMDGHVKFNADATYPILPPKATREWRAQRHEDTSIYIPKLEGASANLTAFFYENTYVLEQYGIPGEVEAMPGDTVLDCGAFIGDTALYFAKKVGGNGKVFAFDPMPRNVRDGERNAALNNVDNIEFVPCAISDSEKTLYFTEETFSSTCHVTDDKSAVAVPATSIDSFVRKRNITVDYIKCDLEGHDIEMLHGAEQTITRDGPTLGLALYHNQEDFLLIPGMVSSWRNDYRLYFRCEAEPCLLAITEARHTKLQGPKA